MKRIKVKPYWLIKDDYHHFSKWYHQGLRSPMRYKFKYKYRNWCKIRKPFYGKYKSWDKLKELIKNVQNRKSQKD